MLRWKVATLILCTYGVFKEFRPSEPFLTEYLVGPPVNLTYEEVTQDVYPVWPYSYLALLPLVFVTTDVTRYKPVILIEGAAYIITWCILIWGRSVSAMQTMEFFYGVATSTEIAYYTYIYAAVDKSQYRLVTGLTRASFLVGKLLAATLSQILVNNGLLDYCTLNFVSLSSVSVAFIVACFLPKISHSVYFNNSDVLSQHGRPLLSEKCIKAYEQLKLHFVDAYCNKYVLMWSAWWAFGTACYLHVCNFIQLLWIEKIVPENGMTKQNGAVEAIATALGAMAAILLGLIKINWHKFWEVAVFVLSICQGVCLITMAGTSNIIICYAGYVLFKMIYQGIITVAGYEIAEEIKDESAGLIFGVNCFVALILQTIFTIFLTEDSFLALLPSLQFTIFGVYCMLLGSMYMMLFLLKTENISNEVIHYNLASLDSRSLN